MQQQAYAIKTGYYHQQRAITLIETLIVVAILGVLAALAYPSLLNFIQSNQVRSATNELISSLDYAKGEAITRGYSVTVCPISSTDDSDVVCGDRTDWSNGWAVFLNEVNATTGTLPANQDDLLRVVDDISDTLVWSTAINLINFQSSGFPAPTIGSNPGIGDIEIMPKKCMSDNQRLLNISATGRVDVDAQTCSTPPP